MNELDAPRWEIELDGGGFLAGDLRRMISSVKVEATVDGADELVIRAHSYDAERGRYLWQPGEPLGGGSSVVVWAGYGDRIEPLQRFWLPRRGTNESAGKAPEKEIVGYSAEAAMVAWEQSRSWGGPVSDSEIIREIAKDHGLEVTAESVEQVEPRQRGRTKPKGTNDWDFVRSLAYANGLGDPWVRWDQRLGASVLFWRRTRIENQSELVTFRMRTSDSQPSTLLRFAADYSSAHVPTAVEVVGWDPVAGEPIRVVVTIEQGAQRPSVYRGRPGGPVSPRVRSGTQLQIANLAASGRAGEDRREVVALDGAAPRTEGELLDWAQRWLDTRNRAWMRGSATTIGYERAWVGQLHRFAGVDPEFAGLYEAQQVTHEWDAGSYKNKWEIARILEEPGATIEGG